MYGQNSQQQQQGYPNYPYPPNTDIQQQPQWSNGQPTYATPEQMSRPQQSNSGWYVPPAQAPIAGPSTSTYPPSNNLGYPPGNSNAGISYPQTAQPRSNAYTSQAGVDGVVPETFVAPVKSGSGGEKAVTKKKRKKVSQDDGISPTVDGDKDKDKEKRTKTGRACDACIRCDILQPVESPTLPSGTEIQPICAHCKQAGLECTFFLPITETRFKKRKAADQGEGINSGMTNSPSILDGPRLPPSREVSSRVEGSTSLSFLLQTSIPASASEAFDLREHNRWEIYEDRNGLIRVSAPPSATGYADADPEDPTKAHNRLNKPVLSGHTISLLVNAYFDHIAPLFPIVSRSEFTSKASPGPLLLYSICGLGATRREFPREVFAGVRGVINGLLRSNDILSDARFENVQALLLLSQVGDLHAQPTAATASASLIRMGTATRMAQDLGLHRESALRAQTAQDLAYIELRRRVWTTCVILDRWYGAALGIPLLVDLLDCDVLLPAPYEIVPDIQPNDWPVEPSFMALAEHLKLSVLIGRVLKTIYSPTGLKYATDDQLEGILADMTSWKEGLPEQLQYKGTKSSTAAGLLHMSHAALQFLFWRVFMRITYTCPAHIQFRLTPIHWTAVVDWSRESIEWLAENDSALDTIFIFAYTATSCALVQYHTWARRRDRSALDTLRIVKDVAAKWEKEVQPDQMSIRRKTCETMTLLYEAALKTNPDFDEAKDRPTAINPTPGVLPRADLGKAIWIKDPARPNGGYWMAQTEQEAAASGVPLNYVVIGEFPEKAAEAARTPLSMPTPATADRAGVEEGGSGLGLFQDIQSGRNVNPQMNTMDYDGLQGQGTVQNGMDFGHPQQAVQGQGIQDFSLLDGIPMSGFDFPSWEVYFQTINSSIPQDGYQGM